MKINGWMNAKSKIVSWMTRGKTGTSDNILWMVCVRSHTCAVEYLQPTPPHSSRSAQGTGKMSLSIKHDV